MKEIFNPRSIAVIGASNNPRSVGYGIVKNLKEGGSYITKFNKPFKGKFYAVNPNADYVLGLKSYPSIRKIKDKIDLVIIAVRSSIVPKVMKECASKKVKVVIIISAGFAEYNKEGKKLQEFIVKIARKSKIKLVGPNCLGIINTKLGMNASFAPVMPPQGAVAFVTQSGALADSVIDWSIDKNYGFSKLVSIGNAAQLNINDYLKYLSKDKDTKSIAVYIESIKEGRNFMKVAKASKKPIIIIKAGKTSSGKSAVSSHTGNLAGSYEVYKAAFKQCGAYMVDTVEELFDTAKALAYLPKCKNNIGIITNGGGCGVLTADYCEEFGINLARLKKDVVRKLDKSKKMHPAYSRRNPLDIVGDALPERYEVAISSMLSSRDVKGLIVLQTLQTMTDPVGNAKVILKARKRYPKKPIICVYMGGKFTMDGRRFLEAHNIPVYDDPRKAALAMKALVQ